MTGAILGPEIDGLVFLEHLGAGGYSDVFLYERRSPRMKVAVKVLKDVRLSESELAQFAAEAETMAELADHPYIVQVFSTDATADGRPYLVMKYYPPPDLGTRAARERFSVADVLRTGVKISSAVEAAHRAGILHRDIKPANVLISQYGEPGLTDFGIAGHTADAAESDDLGVSIPWVAPEVLSGASNGTVQSDVYSLAATIWHLLVGRSPFEIAGGDNTSRVLMARVLRSPPPSSGRADVPQSLERLLQQAMAKSPAVRPRSALEFARALQGVEQERRFSRTDIVVDGTGTARARSAANGPGEDQTRMRAVRPTPAPPRRGQPPAETPSVAPPSAPSPSAPPRAALGHEEPASTVLRPATPTPEPPSIEPRRRGLKPPQVGIIAAALVIAAVVVGVVLSSGRSPSQPGAKDPSLLATGQLLAPDPPQQPSVTPTYDAKTKIVHFSWTYENPEAGDYFLWALTVDAVAKRVDGPPELALAATDPGKTCVVVRVVRAGGQPSLFSNPTCG